MDVTDGYPYFHSQEQLKGKVFSWVPLMKPIVSGADKN